MPTLELTLKAKWNEDTGKLCDAEMTHREFFTHF